MRMHVSSTNKILIGYGYALFGAIFDDDIQTVSEILHYFPLDFRYKHKHIYKKDKKTPLSAQYENVLGMNIVGVVVKYGNTEILKFVLDKGYDMYTWSTYTSDISFLMLMYKSPFLFLKGDKGIKMVDSIIRILSDHGYNWNRKYITRSNVSFLGKIIITAIVETINCFEFQLFKLLLDVGSDPYQTIQIIYPDSCYPDSCYHESLDYMIDNLIDNAYTKAQLLDCLESYRLTTSKLLYMHLFSLLSVIENNEIQYQPYDYSAYHRIYKFDDMLFYRSDKCIFINRRQREHEREREREEVDYAMPFILLYTPKNTDDIKIINNKPLKIYNRHKSVIKNIHKTPHRKCYPIQQMHRSSKSKY